jgi:hypothetical protein
MPSVTKCLKQTGWEKKILAGLILERETGGMGANGTSKDKVELRSGT